MASCINHHPNSDFHFVCGCLKEKASNDVVASYILGLYQKRLLLGLPVVLTARQIETFLWGIRELGTIQARLRFLVNCDLLAEDSFDRFHAAQICQSRKPWQFNPTTDLHYERCSWCASPTVILHDHHYPIPRFEGGTDTVSICPQCHGEYHFLNDNKFYRPTLHLLDWFTEEHPMRLTGRGIDHVVNQNSQPSEPQNESRI
jgi:hypothetical protein